MDNNETPITEAAPVQPETVTPPVVVAEAVTPDSNTDAVSDSENASAAQVQPTPVISQSKTKYLNLAAQTVLALALLFVGMLYFNAQSEKRDLKAQLQSLQSNPQALVQKQSDEIVSKVAALMTLPAGETPTVADVSDAAAAKTQSPFFANAQNGDKALLYVKAGQAILYRPSTNKIILVAPLTFNSTPAAAAPAATTTKR